MRVSNVGFVVRQLVWSAACVLAAGAVTAADAPADDELDQVVVTGSRLATSGFSTPTPVTVLGAEAIEELGITNIGAGANQLPAFRATTTPTTNGFGSFNVGAQIVNLRGLGVTRNLVLVDGRRFAPVTREGTVDLNLMPERPGGAHSTSSRAARPPPTARMPIAGVGQRDPQQAASTGIKAQLDYGVTNVGDGGQNYARHPSPAAATVRRRGRGHFIIGGEYDKQDGIGDCFTRDFCTTSGVTVANTGNPVSGAIAGQPANLVRVNDAGGGFIVGAAAAWSIGPQQQRRPGRRGRQRSRCHVDSQPPWARGPSPSMPRAPCVRTGSARPSSGQHLESVATDTTSSDDDGAARWCRWSATRASGMRGLRTSPTASMRLRRSLLRPRETA